MSRLEMSIGHVLTFPTLTMQLLVAPRSLKDTTRPPPVKAKTSRVPRPPCQPRTRGLTGLRARGQCPARGGDGSSRNATRATGYSLRLGPMTLATDVPHSSIAYDTRYVQKGVSRGCPLNFCKCFFR